MVAVGIAATLLIGFLVWTKRRWDHEDAERNEVPCVECGQPFDYHADQSKFIHSYTRRDT